MHFAKIILTAFILAVLYQGSVVAQPAELIKDEEFRPVLLAAIDSAYNFQFEGSRKILESWENKYPDHPIWTFWKGFILWWKMLPDLESHQWDKKFFNTMEKSSYQAAQILKEYPNHVDGIIIQSASLGYMARMHANRRDWIKAMQIGRNALNAFERLKKVDPTMSDIPFGDGLYSYYMAYVPETYPVVKSISWMLPDGDKQEGIEGLEKAAEEGLLTQGEAYYFLGNIYLNYEDKPEKAIGYLNKLIKKYPRNNYYARALIHAYINAGEKLQAKVLTERWIQHWDFENDPLGNVMKEELYALSARFNAPDNKKAVVYAAKQVGALSNELYGGYNRPMQQMAHYYHGLVLYKQGDYNLSINVLNKISDVDNPTPYGKEAKTLLKKIKKR